MSERTWQIDLMHWGGGEYPTHITVQLSDPTLYPAVEQFAHDEGLNVTPFELGERDESWLAYPRDDFEQAKMRLDQRITDLYWEH